VRGKAARAYPTTQDNLWTNNLPVQEHPLLNMGIQAISVLRTQYSANGRLSLLSYIHYKKATPEREKFEKEKEIISLNIFSGCLLVWMQETMK
jgi:hypothetical protein